MKKLFLIFGVLLASLTVNASYLLWQIEDYTAGEDESDWDAVAVYLYDTHDKKVLYDAGRLNIYAGGQSVPGNVLYAGGDKETLLNQTYAADWSDDYTAEGYTYYVEYYKYETNASVDFTTDKKVAGGISTATELYDSAGSVADLPSSAWATPLDTTYTTVTVPEPTSGLMLLFGAAMLGLKRKNRSRA